MKYVARRNANALTILLTLLTCGLVCSLFSCSGDEQETVAASNENDSLPFMHARGVSTLISDSGVMKYHLVTEEWDIFNKEGEPATWKFYKGFLMERYDNDFHVDLYVQADTSYLHRQQLWELRGRVVIRNANDELFLTEELFWDMTLHEMWSHKYIRIITPERELEGTEFRSNEQMTKYMVSNSIGAFPVSDAEDDTATADDAAKNAEPEKKDNATTATQQPEEIRRPAPDNRSKQKGVPLRFAPDPRKEGMY